MEVAPRIAPPWAPTDLAPGVLILDASASGTPIYRLEIRIADLPRDPRGRQWTTEGLTAAIEDRAFRRVCFMTGVYLCGPAPRLHFGPSDPDLAFYAPRFGTPTFWRRLQLHGAYRICSFEWPPGMTLGAGPSARADTRPPARHLALAENTASLETAWRAEDEGRASSASESPGLP